MHLDCFRYWVGWHARLVRVGAALVCLAYAAASAFGAPASCLETQIRALAADKKVCKSNFCYDNVLRLANRLEAEIPGFNLDRARVLYVIAPETGLRALRTRKGPYPWAFHAVLEYEGKVLDLDFHGVQRVLPLQDYLKKMFIFPNTETELLMNTLGVTSLNNQKILQTLRVRPIPARDYIRDYGYADLEGHNRAVRDFTYYVSDRAEADYPSQSVAALLKVKPEDARTLYGPTRSNPRESRIYERLGVPVVLVRRATRPAPKIGWEHKGVVHEFDLKDGSVLLNDGYREVLDPAAVQVFLKKIYYQMRNDPELRKAIDEAKVLRKTDHRFSPY